MNYLGLFVCIIVKLSYLSFTVNGLKFEGIRGGNEAHAGTFKYQVAIFYARFHICGGGIIGDEFAVTAAHCVINEDTNKFKTDNISIVAATINVLSPEVFSITIQVIKIYVPKSYKPINKNYIEYYRTPGDIAVLKLEHKLGLNTNTNLNKLIIPNERLLYVSETLIIAGHGDNKVMVKVLKKSKSFQYKEIKEADGKLRFAETVVVSNEYCSFFFDNPILTSNICAAVVQRDDNIPEGVCSGDSGSPLVYNDIIIVGILSSSPLECREDEKPSVYTRLSDYSSFINNAMENKELDSMRVAKWKYKTSYFGRNKFVEV